MNSPITSIISHIDDEATPNDQLNRNSFAQSLADLIINAPENTSFRVGVYGDWGTGKTSVLKMMEGMFKLEVAVTAWIRPWSAQTVDELRIDTLRAIVNAIDSETVDRLNKTTKGHLVAENILKVVQTQKDFAWWTKIASGALDIGNEARKKWLDGVTEDSLQKGFEKLGDRKVVVFIDDLDRLRPELLPDLLLNLRETLNLPNVYYVLALSPEIVKEGLHELHRGWDNPMRFLEKIIEYPFILPAPTKEEIGRFIKANIAALGDAVDARVLSELTPLLPQNPRQIKLFLRFLACLRGHLKRFDPKEISLYRLYICQLLRMEFPLEAMRLAEDSVALDSISSDYLENETRRSMERASGKPQEPVSHPEEKIAPDKKLLKKRFLPVVLGSPR